MVAHAFAAAQATTKLALWEVDHPARSSTSCACCPRPARRTCGGSPSNQVGDLPEKLAPVDDDRLGQDDRPGRRTGQALVQRGQLLVGKCGGRRRGLSGW